MGIIRFLCIVISLVLMIIITWSIFPSWYWVLIIVLSVSAGIWEGLRKNKRTKTKKNNHNIQNFRSKPVRPVMGRKKSTCSAGEAAAILAAAEMMYKKKHQNDEGFDEDKFDEGLDEDFDDFYDDFLDQIDDVDNDNLADKDDYEQEILDQMDYYENILKDT